MNINSLLNSNMSNLFGSGTSGADATAASSAIANALAKADQRVQTAQSATTAQLSSFGLLKSALAGSQSAAQAMEKLSPASTGSDTTQTMADFFNHFNATITAANNTASLTGADGASASAKRVSRDVQWALNSQSTVIAAMKAVGLSVQSDGSLHQDAKKFAAALASDPTQVRQAMATIGKAIDAVASAELGGGGAVGATIASLSQHNTALTAQHNALAALQQNAAGTSASTNTNTNASTGSGSTAGAHGLTPAQLATLMAPSSGAGTGFLGYGLSAYQSNTSGA